MIAEPEPVALSLPMCILPRNVFADWVTGSMITFRVDAHITIIIHLTFCLTCPFLSQNEARGCRRKEAGVVHIYKGQQGCEYTKHSVN